MSGEAAGPGQSRPAPERRAAVGGGVRRSPPGTPGVGGAEATFLPAPPVPTAANPGDRGEDVAQWYGSHSYLARWQSRRPGNSLPPAPQSIAQLGGGLWLQVGSARSSQARSPTTLPATFHRGGGDPRLRRPDKEGTPITPENMGQSPRPGHTAPLRSQSAGSAGERNKCLG